MTMLRTVPVGLIGAGRIGSSHAEIIARRVPGADLVAVADPRPGVAETLGASMGARGVTDVDDIFAAPDIEAVVIAASSDAHCELVIAAARAGKAVFCEKPMSMTLSDAGRAISAAHDAGVPLQVGFNRRFAADFVAAHDAIVGGSVGTPQLMRSVTRDPGLANPAGVPPWTVFTQTLIHDFDALLWLNPGAQPVEVYATADALVAPEFKQAGLLDTAVVVITFDNGARAVAEASFSATLRVRRPRGGVRFGRDGHGRDHCTHRHDPSRRQRTPRGDGPRRRGRLHRRLHRGVRRVHRRRT